MHRLKAAILVFIVGMVCVSFGPAPPTASAAVPTKPEVIKKPVRDLPALGGPVAPAAPSLLVATAVKSSVELTWQGNADNRSNYTVERRSGNGGRYYELKALGPGTTRFTDTAVQGGETYYYRVKAFINQGDKACSSAYSNEAVVSLPAAGPSVINTGRLVYTGRINEIITSQLVYIGRISEITTGPLIYTGRTQEITTGQLVYTGTISAIITSQLVYTGWCQEISTGQLIYTGRAQQAGED